MSQESKPIVAYRAIGNTYMDCGQSAATPRAAAESFFQRFPRKRKCTVLEGVLERGRFVQIYSLINDELSHASFVGVTRKSMLDLPGGVPPGALKGAGGSLDALRDGMRADHHA